MALSKDVRGSVGVPRVYIDFPTYAEDINHIQKARSWNISWGADQPDSSLVWGLNPHHIKKYKVSTSNHGTLAFKLYYNNFNWNGETSDSDPQWSNLMDTANYYGVLGHEAAMVTDIGHWRLQFQNQFNDTIKFNNEVTSQQKVERLEL